MLDETDLHRNTQTLLKAWRRMQDPAPFDTLPEKTQDHPDLLQRLFVIEQDDTANWQFCNAGRAIEGLLGRTLADHDFLGLWRGHDRYLVRAQLASILEARYPGHLLSRGETLTGQRIDLELTLAPLPGKASGSHKVRLLGLYQPLGMRAQLMGRPVWRHRLTAIFPPDTSRHISHLKLVANND
ncbi:MAG: PAS domain-containing protein [Pseudomonadota bacterium]